MRVITGEIVENDLAAHRGGKAILTEKAEVCQGFSKPEGVGGRFYLSILCSLPSSILVIDRGLRAVFANDNFFKKSRREEEEVIGERIGEIFPQVILDVTAMEEKIRRIFETSKPFEGGEMEYRAPGLAQRVYFYRLTPLKDREGSVKYVMLFMDDVTEKKSLGERVIRAERHLASVVESANDIIISLDAKGSVMSWNTAAERILGFSTHDMVGRPFSQIFSTRDQEDFQFISIQLAEDAVLEKETYITTKDGKQVLVSWRFSGMRDDSGQIIALVGVGRDLTEKRCLELQLIQSAKMAALGEMAGGIAHEIRNPLAIISSAVQILHKKGDEPPIKRECIHKIRTATQRAATIIENLLRFARPSESLFSLVDINNALEEALSLIEHQIFLQNIKIKRMFDSELPQVIGNRNQLQQVFMNIILNACNAMSNGGNLTISTMVKHKESPIIDSEKFIEISFTDTGCGIPNENLSRIFDPFFTTMEVGKGTGLGLSIAYSIVQHHEGFIKVKSNLGEGSTFTVCLPIGNSK